MSRNAEIWANLQQLMSAPSAHYGEAVNRRVEAVGMGGLRLGLLLHAYQFEPAPITAHALQTTIPYYSTGPFKEGFHKLVEQGFLVGDGAYRLTSKGRYALIDIFSAANEALIHVENTLPQDDLTRLHALLRQLDAAVQHDTHVLEKFCYQMQRQIVPANPPSLLAEISDFVSGLHAFRCDCHRQSWQAHGVSGPAWESLTTLWRKEADSAETLAEKLGKARPIRGYTRDDYWVYLQELIAKGWVVPQTGHPGKYKLTAEGTHCRQASEDETDRLFYRVWNAAETDELEPLTLKIVAHLTVGVGVHSPTLLGTQAGKN